MISFLGPGTGVPFSWIQRMLLDPTTGPVDAFPIGKGGFPASYVSLPEV